MFLFLNASDSVFHHSKVDQMITRYSRELNGQRKGVSSWWLSSFETVEPYLFLPLKALIMISADWFTGSSRNAHSLIMEEITALLSMHWVCA